MLQDRRMGRRGVILVVVLALIAVLAAIATWWVSRATTITTGTGGPLYGTPTDLGVPAGATEATVEYVHDGDTLFLTDGRKVRLLGVDTPEVGENAECYGDEATALLRSMLPEGTAVHVLADAQPLDQFDRSLLLLWLPASDQDAATFVNLELIEHGAAEAVVLEPNLLYAEEFEAAEDAARAGDLGLWAACR
jgi:endonuclease YncB( thermonuclease family)